MDLNKNIMVMVVRIKILVGLFFQKISSRLHEANVKYFNLPLKKFNLNPLASTELSDLNLISALLLDVTTSLGTTLPQSLAN